jgi:acetyltransferase-like isoleucine patch superfamily enzyme
MTVSVPPATFLVGRAERQHVHYGPSSDPDPDASRHERLQRHEVSGSRNSLRHWIRTRNPVWMLVVPAIIWTLRLVPSVRLKNVVLRALGADVGVGVALAFGATPDMLWPDNLVIEDDAIVGYDATLLCHEYLQDEYRIGTVEVGERAMIGAGAVVLPGVRIGADAQVAANSLVTEDVPSGATVAGVPAEIVQQTD